MLFFSCCWRTYLLHNLHNLQDFITNWWYLHLFHRSLSVTIQITQILWVPLYTKSMNFSTRLLEIFCHTLKLYFLLWWNQFLYKKAYTVNLNLHKLSAFFLLLSWKHGRVEKKMVSLSPGFRGQNYDSLLVWNGKWEKTESPHQSDTFSVFLCSEWRCAQPKETAALLCKHLKACCSDSLLRDGRMLLIIHLFHCVLCLFQHKGRESGKFVIATQTQTPKLWMGASSRHWVGAEGTWGGYIIYAQRRKHSVLSKLHVPKIERKYSLVTSCPQPHTENLLSVTSQMTKCSKYSFFPYLFTETTLRCKSLKGWGPSLSTNQCFS